MVGLTKGEKDPAIEHITMNYLEVSTTINLVSEYIRKESMSNDQYKGNILTVDQTDQLDSLSPV